MVNEQDRAKILAFVHGELDQLETQKLATRIEAEEPLRQEFEALLAASDALEDLFLQPAKDDLSEKQIQEIMAEAKGPTKGAKLVPFTRPKKSFFIAGGAVFAASLAFVLFMKMDKAPHEETQAEADMTAAAPVAESRGAAGPIAGGGGVPPVDNLAQNSAQMKADAAPAAPADAEAKQENVAMNEPHKDLRAASPSKFAKGAAKMGGLGAKKKAPAKEQESAEEGLDASADMMVADSGAAMAASPPVPPAAESAPQEMAKVMSTGDAAMMGAKPKKMGVIASRVKFTKNMSNKKALLFLQQKLDGKTSCIPTQLSMIKTMQVVIAVDKTGLIKSIKTTPSSPDTVKCLKAKLGNKPAAFKPANKANGTITFQLKNF